MDKPFITDPTNGEKVTCHKCNEFIVAGEGIKYAAIIELNTPDVWFHVECFNRYEHYYGLDRPID